MCNVIVGGVLAVVAAAMGFMVTMPRNEIPPHLLGGALIAHDSFLDDKTVDALLQMSRDFDGGIKTASREYDSYKCLNEHIGEAEPIGKDGKCSKPYLMPNGNMTLCVFPGRMDVGRHYVRSGGPEALKESYETLVSRVQPFQAIILDWQKYDAAKMLLEDARFLKLARDVCPKDKPFLDPFQFNLVVQVPGQTVALHLDAPYFQRASRFSVPQWLLATMVFSGLFQDSFIDQVQVVGYYHKWKDPAMKRGGIFKFYDTSASTPRTAFPFSGSANSVDGSKMVHAAAVYYPERLPPKLPKESKNVLQFNKAKGLWDVTTDGEVVATYPEDDIRFSAVYRAKCFKDAAAVEQYKKDQENPLTVDEILNVFKADLQKKGKWSPESKLSTYDFGLLLLDTYVRYPYSEDAWVPFNWCALDRVWPVLKPVVKALCK